MRAKGAIHQAPSLSRLPQRLKDYHRDIFCDHDWARRQAQFAPPAAAWRIA